MAKTFFFRIFQDDLLDYLNNHRGGFFRFFNGGASFGEGDDYYEQDEQQNYQAQHNYRPQPVQQIHQTTTQSPVVNKFQTKYPLYSQQNYPQDFPQYSQQNAQTSQNQQQQSTYTNLAALQGFADTINSGGGINLSNLGQNLGFISSLAQLMGGGGGSNNNQDLKRPVKKPVTDDEESTSSGGVGEFVTNLLTGLVGNRFSGRRINKRSVDSGGRDSENDEIRQFLLSLINQQKPIKKKKGASRKRNLNVELADHNEPYSSVKSSRLDKTLLKLLELTVNTPTSITKEDESLSPRIINVNQQPIDAIESNSITKFFPNELPQYTTQNTRRPKESVVEFFPHEQQIQPEPATTTHGSGAVSFQNIFTFPSAPQAEPFSTQSNRSPKSIQFGTPQQQTKIHFQDDIDIPRPLDYYDNTKMIFPDRTGTGNLRFDNDQLFRVGKILTRPPQEPTATQSNYDDGTVNQNGGGSYQYFNRYPENSNYNNNRQQSSYQPQQYTTKRPQTYYNNYNSNKYSGNNYNYRPHSSSSSNRGEDTSQNIYVTNSRGVVEYYLNARGEKVYT